MRRAISGTRTHRTGVACVATLTCKPQLPTPWRQPRKFAAALGTSVSFIGVSMGLGDAVCQGLEVGLMQFSYESWNAIRSARMLLVGAVVTGPFSHCWQLVLESALPGTTRTAVLVKTAANALYAFVFSVRRVHNCPDAWRQRQFAC